jgi:hypothetical protein
MSNPTDRNHGSNHCYRSHHSHPKVPNHLHEAVMDQLQLESLGHMNTGGGQQVQYYHRYIDGVVADCDDDDDEDRADGNYDG